MLHYIYRSKFESILRILKAGEKQASSEVANLKVRSSAAEARLTAAHEQTLSAQEEAGEWKRKYDVAEAKIKDKARKIEQAKQRVTTLSMELKGLSNLYFMRGFLWSHGALKQGQAKVGWSDVYEINFWDIPVLNDVCWGWKKILQCRDAIRDHIVYRFGDGSTVSIWFDNNISKRYIFEAGLSLNRKVCDLVKNNEWKWP
ncbi:hypothetical protein Tco_1344732 [Tanacetum coccineum]